MQHWGNDLSWNSRFLTKVMEITQVAHGKFYDFEKPDESSISSLIVCHTGKKWNENWGFF